MFELQAILSLLRGTLSVGRGAGRVGHAHGLWTAPAALAVALAACGNTARAADDGHIVIPFTEQACEPGTLVGAVSLKSRGPLGDRVKACIVHNRTEVVVKARVVGLSGIAGGSRTDDTGFGDSDFFGIALDPDGNGADVYYFLTTPQGTRYEIASRSTRFRAHWTSAVAVGDGTWTTEMRIPLASFGWHAGSERRLRVNFVGQYVDRSERYTLAYDPTMQDAVPPAWPVFRDSRFWRYATVDGPVAAQHRTSSAVNLFGLESTGEGHQQYATPDGTIVTRRTRTTGVDATAVYGEAAKLVVTLAPDFSNVDADQLTVLPQEFRRTYAEYRPFFVEDAALFTAPVDTAPLLGNQLFYSPQFESVDAGYKFTAKRGSYRVGMLSFHGSSLDETGASGSAIVSLRHTDPQQRTLWWAMHGNALVNGIADGINTLGAATKSGPMQYALQWSSTVGAHDGRAATGSIEYRRDDNRLNVNYAAISPGYDPVMGYTSVTDIRGLGGFGQLRFRTPRSTALEYYGLYVEGDRFVDRFGAAHLADSSVDGEVRFRRLPLRLWAGANISVLRSYAADGGPAGTGSSVFYNAHTVQAYWREGSSHAVSFEYDWGPSGGSSDVHRTQLNWQVPVGSLRLALGYASVHGASARPSWLSRLGIGGAIAPGTELGINQRYIDDGVLVQNLSAVLHSSTPSGETYMSFGTPSPRQTLHRILIKHIFKMR